MFCIVVQLIDVCLMIADKEEGCKKLEEQIGRFASAEGFVSQTEQFKSYSEFNRKPMQLM